MGRELLLYPSAIGSEPEAPGYDSQPHWETVMRGHAAANLMPVVASNRIGAEPQGGREVVFYGSSSWPDRPARYWRGAAGTARRSSWRRWTSTPAPRCGAAGACSATGGPTSTGGWPGSRIRPSVGCADGAPGSDGPADVVHGRRTLRLAPSAATGAISRSR
ncbi:nitrilase-related carbon-nitrogen hydrolase [Rubellimicrobium mesophilum]|uniref:nitrilase-related carbon-nitrogen hydrolase n=1 Tax=Rubellimicrobium mesophilum TaxID=1123067 RepID=UPI00247FDFB4|nr:nitrilase-related carbon-nitrogen hydrolase [Rubellimicrobium mesophilum]